MDFKERISVDQLRIGLFVELDGWMDHPFLFNSFKIRNEQQLKALRSLAVKDLIWVRDKSDFPPLPPAPVSAVSQPKAEPDPEVLAMWQAKKKHREELAEQRVAFGRCEKKFTSGMATVRSVLRNLISRPHESVQQAHEFIVDVVDSLLVEKDVLLHLMNAKSGDEGAYYHALNVAMLALMLARGEGFEKEEMHALGMGCLLHDMGKARVPSKILLKRETWTTAERNFYQQHVLYGVELAQQLPSLQAGAMEVIAMHHEMLDGSGFPGGLTGERIGKFARVAAIANGYDNLCNRPNPADSMTPAEAVSHMFKHEQARYDSHFMQHFIRSLGVYPPGSIVKLNNDAIGLVTSVNPGRLLHPMVLLYDKTVPKDEALQLDLSEDPGLKVVASLRPGSLDKEVFDYLSPRSRISYYADMGAGKVPV